MDGLPVASTLGLMLKQLGLTYFVHDEGFVVITSKDREPDLADASAEALDIVNAIRLDVAAMRAELNPFRNAALGALAPAPRVVKVFQPGEGIPRSRSSSRSRMSRSIRTRRS